MIKKHLTCKTNLKHYGNNVIVARLDTDSPDQQNIVHTEVGERWENAFGIGCQVTPDRHFLIGEIANRLHEYELLNYTPDELREIIRYYNVYKSAEESMHHPYLIAGRGNGKSLRAAANIIEYMMNDVQTTQQLYVWRKNNPYLPNSNTLEIEKVIFNDPATIVIWKDGTKTVVKATNEKYDPEKGLAMAITKKALGNKGNYFETIKKWTGEYEETRTEVEEEVLYFNNKPVRMTAGNKTYPIKSNETCERCNWAVNNPGCSQHKYCEGCPNITESPTGCKCSLIKDGEPCQYFEEVSNNG